MLTTAVICIAVTSILMNHIFIVVILVLLVVVIALRSASSGHFCS